MKTYITYKNEIQGLKRVGETLKLIEKIASSSIHNLKLEVSNLNTYSGEIENILSRFFLFCENNISHPLLEKKKSGEKTLIILSGDKGLVGGLWHKLINKFLEKRNVYNNIIITGKKGEAYLREENIKYIKFFTDYKDDSLKEKTKNITDYVYKEFIDGKFIEVDILYPKFISIVNIQPTFIPFLPFKFEKQEKLFDIGGIPIFEPSKQEFFQRLLPKYINIYLYKIILETKLAEFSAKTIEMEHAYVKTNKLVDKLVFNNVKEHRKAKTQQQLESFKEHKIND